MMRERIRWKLRCLGMAAVAAAMMMPGLIGVGYAQHSSVQLRSFSGAAINGTSTYRDVPYSPKKTCVTGPNGSCHHDSYAQTVDGELDNIYESHWTTAAKTQWNRTGGAAVSYEVPYAQHGVSASYHVQMGMNTPWGDLQREYYALPEFTSSPGHFGGY